MKLTDALEGVVAPGGEHKQLDTKPPEDSNVVSSMAIEAQVENKPQELNKLRGFHAMTKSVPSTLKPEAQITLQALFSCFDRQKSVKEGKLADLVWGFEQAGIPGPATMIGLLQLKETGYVRFRAPDGSFVDPGPKNLEHLWVTYERKLMDMVYEGSASK